MSHGDSFLIMVPLFLVDHELLSTAGEVAACRAVDISHKTASAGATNFAGEVASVGRRVLKDGGDHLGLLSSQ